MTSDARVAYLSMEIALDPRMPTYAGGLGILAGDTLRSAADLHVPMVAISLLHRKGYLQQRLDASGWQHEESCEWQVDQFLTEAKRRVQVQIEDRTVHIRAWEFTVKGADDYSVPVFLLDTDLTENAPWDRALTHYLYGGDAFYRLLQEIILGIGGLRMLRALGYRAIERYHLNEGHAALLTLELLLESARSLGRNRPNRDDVTAVRRRCVFTTHTPVPAGHDQFPLGLVARVLGWNRGLLDLRDVLSSDPTDQEAPRIESIHQPLQGVDSGETLNLTHLALNLSHYVNGVAKKHGEVSRLMFAGYEVDAITNGVHASTWTSKPFQALFDRRIPGWRLDNFSLRYAHGVPLEELWAAHVEAKQALIDRVNTQANAAFDLDTLTIGFARRATAYKRPYLILQQSERLRAIARTGGTLQIVFAGKAHPNDHAGKELIQRIIGLNASLAPEIRMVYLPGYDMELAGVLTSGVDVWLNTPQPPLEASGTSGMKAALNGVPSLSILDGWWIEGCIEGATGWAIKSRSDSTNPAEDAEALYERLEKAVLPMFYQHREKFSGMMRHAIAVNGSFFNTQRMMQQYVLKAYFE